MHAEHPITAASRRRQAQPCVRLQFLHWLLTQVGADGVTPAVHALAPHSVVLADGGAPAVLAFAPHSVVLADGG